MRWLIAAPLSFVVLLFQSAWLALGQIWANKVRSILTTIGIVIGVASVTAVIASLTGLKAKVLEDFESFGTNKIYIWPERPKKGPKSTAPWWQIRFRPEQFGDMLEHCPSVENFTRMTGIGQFVVRHGEFSAEGVRVNAVEPAWTAIENRPVTIGRPFSVIDDSQSQQVCLIDAKLRDELRLDKDCVGDFLLMGAHTFRIVGIIEQKPQMGIIGGGNQDYFEMYIPFRTSLKFNREPWISVIATSKSTDVSEEARAEISFFLRRTRGIKPGEPDTFQAFSVESELKKFNQVAMMITLVAGGVVGISLLVGGVGIMNIMLVSVSERTREIGLRKAVGARRSAILMQFLVESVVLCFVGGLVGVGFGKLLTVVISRIGTVMDKTHIPLWAILLSFGFAGCVGIIFGMVPAIKAARLDPIEALRHE